MKFNMKLAREIWFQRLGESNKEFKQKCLQLMIQETITNVQQIRDFRDFNIIREENLKKKLGKFIIEFKLK